MTPADAWTPRRLVPCSIDWLCVVGYTRTDSGSATSRSDEAGLAGSVRLTGPLGRTFAAGLVLAAIAPAVVRAQGDPCAEDSSFHVLRSFPTTGLAKTSWDIQACVGRPHGLAIQRTLFQKTPSAAPVQILHDARVSEIFVVYDNGSFRIYDITEVSRGLLRLGDVECPPALGARLMSDTVCMEIRDRGLAWKDDTGARRGQELVLWSVIDATNYKYVVEWTFRDDGVIVGRVGATGRNNPLAHDVAHMHNVMWRLDLDLDGPDGDSVYFSRHRWKKDSGSASEREILVARERGIPWLAPRFTTLSIYDATLRNAQGKPSAYRLIPWRLGTARHTEAFTRSDFWVTRSQGKGTEMLAREIPSYVVPAEPVVGTDVVVWYSGPVLHIERDEDDLGPTQAMWVGFMLQPHDLFDRSPLYP